MNHHQEKASTAIKEVAADFLNRHPLPVGLVTVTRAKLRPDGSKATVFVSVLPENLAADMLIQLRHVGGEMQDYLRQRLKLGRLPFLDFEIEES